jgi:hypothetical protein
MKTSNFYAVAPLSPVNRTAASVTARGEAWSPKIAPTSVMSHAPLPVFPITPVMRSSGDFDDLTGRTFGRLTVVGYGGKGKQRDKGARWVCRCVCGTYTYRYKKRLVNPTGSQPPMCAECEKLAYVKSLAVSGNRVS